MNNEKFVALKNIGDIAERHVTELFLHLNLEFIPFGYEKTQPRLAELQRNSNPKNKDAATVYKRIRSMPDFAVVNHGNGKMFLLEIKYRHVYSASEMKKVADSIPECWDVGYIFLVTPQGFFMRSIESISSRGSKPGYMDKLPYVETKGIRLWSPREVQSAILEKINREIGNARGLKNE